MSGRIIKFKDNNYKNYISELHAIDRWATAVELIKCVLDSHENFSGWIMLAVSGIKITFKNGKIHNSHDMPAIKWGKSVRLFIEDGILQTYRPHDCHMLITRGQLYNPQKVDFTVDDIMFVTNSATEDYIDGKVQSFDSPIFYINACSDYFWKFDKDNKRLYSDTIVKDFLKKSKVDKMTPELYNIFVFEQELKEKSDDHEKI